VTANPSLQPTCYGWLRQPPPAAELKRWVAGKGDRMGILRAIGVAAFSLMAVACTTTQYYWRHKTMSGPAAEQQFATDRGNCIAAAYRTVGGPPQAPQLPPPSTTNFSGFTSQGTYFQGQAQTTYSDPNPFWSGMKQAEAENQHRAALSSVFTGCMAQRGWSQYAVTR